MKEQIISRLKSLLMTTLYAIGIIGVLSAGIAGCIVWERTNNTSIRDYLSGPYVPPPPPPKRPGDIIQIMSMTRLAIDDAAWDEMLDAENAKDGVWLAELQDSERVYIVAAGTAARVRDTSVFAYKVRLMGGRFPGVVGWVKKEAVHP